VFGGLWVVRFGKWGFGKGEGRKAKVAGGNFFFLFFLNVADLAK